MNIPYPDPPPYTIKGPWPPPIYSTAWKRPTGDMNRAAFMLLDWPIFDPITSIRVLDLDEQNEPKWTSLFADGQPPQPNHTVAGEPAHDPPRSRMVAVIDDIHVSEYWQDSCAMDQRPAPLIIANDSDEPITVAQFIREFSAYAARHRDLLEELLGIRDPIPQYYCECQVEHPQDDEPDKDDLFYVGLAMEDATSRDKHWARVVDHLRSTSQSQQDEEK